MKTDGPNPSETLVLKQWVARLKEDFLSFLSRVTGGNGGGRTGQCFGSEGKRGKICV